MRQLSLICTLISFTSILAFTSPSLATEPSDSITRSKSLANFRLAEPKIYTLDNGLTLLVQTDKRVPVVSHSIWYKTGAADEQAGESGLAHFLEHLMFKGTKTTKAGYLSKYVATLGGNDNAYTTNDYTVYYQNIASDHLAKMMALEADRMQNLSLTDTEFYKERQVVLEERSMRIDNNPVSLLTEQMSAMLFRNHPYGSPTIGWRHEIANLTPESAMAFYKKYYAPNNAIVIVVGDVTPDNVLKIAEETYGKVAKNPNIKPYIRPTEPPQNVMRKVVLEDSKVTIPMLIYYAQGFSAVTELKKLYALSIGLDALGGGATSRFYKDFVKKRKIALSVGLYTSVESIDASPVMLQALPAPNVSLETLDKEIDTSLKKIIATGLSENEITRAKENMIVDFMRASDSRDNISRFWGSVLVRNLAPEQAMGFAKIISDITVDEVNQALKEVFYTGNRVTGYLVKKTESVVEKGNK